MSEETSFIFFLLKITLCHDQNIDAHKASTDENWGHYNMSLFQGDGYCVISTNFTGLKSTKCQV